jgi:hypothetical protein
LGFLFRKLASDFSERAAQEYLNYGYMQAKETRPALYDALGPDYAKRYETYFLPFVDPKQIGNIQLLGKGQYGIVWSGVWQRNEHDKYGSHQSVPIALKQPRHTFGESQEREDFLNEVISIPLFWIYR